VAGPPGVGYKFRKFVRRHRVGVVAGGLVVIALLAGLSLATVGLVHANRATAEMKAEKIAAEKARAREKEQRALGRTAEAESILLRTLELCGPVLGEDHPFTGAMLNNLGLLLEDRGHFDEAEANFRRAYELYRRVLGLDHPRILIPLNDLLRILRNQKKTETIGSLIAERIAYLRRVALRPGATALALHAYAWELLNCELRSQQDPEAALPMAERAAELSGRKDVNILETLARAYQKTGDLEHAISTQRRAIDLARPGGVHDLAKLEATLFDYRLELGDLAGAIGLTWDGLARGVGRMLFPGIIPDMPLDRQAGAHMAAGRFVEAEEILRGCLAMRRKTLPEGHWLLADTQSRLGLAVAGKGDFALAEQLMVDACTAMEKNRLFPMGLEQQMLERIVQLYNAWEKPERASEWRGRLEELRLEELRLEELRLEELRLEEPPRAGAAEK